jgi:small subunit ribosomal protein S5
MGKFKRMQEQGSDEDRSFDDELVKLFRCATVVKGGRRFSFGALVVAGDRRGRVGFGYGKANEVPPAVEKGRKQALRSLIDVPLRGTTLPHRVIGRFGASRVAMIPASEGTGVIAGAAVRCVLELAGVQDVLTKCYGSTGSKNLVKATLDGLMQLRSRSEVERLRGVKLAPPPGRRGAEGDDKPDLNGKGRAGGESPGKMAPARRVEPAPAGAPAASVAPAAPTVEPPKADSPPSES